MNIHIEQIDRVVIARLNRPQVMNALNTPLMRELITALQAHDPDPNVGCFIITGSDTVFAAGADIKEMYGKSHAEMVNEDYFSGWEAFTRLRTPKIAAVSGLALGGGCELAMMCDIIFAADTARFGQPEIKLGVMPGMGGTQRLTKLIGKARAMDMILTGRLIDAAEAERIGLISRVISSDSLFQESLAAAKLISTYSKPAVLAAREAVDRALELGLSEGMRFERRAFHALFANRDQQEGMAAFIEKRSPVFTNA